MLDTLLILLHTIFSYTIAPTTKAASMITGKGTELVPGAELVLEPPELPDPEPSELKGSAPPPDVVVAGSLAELVPEADVDVDPGFDAV